MPKIALIVNPIAGIGGPISLKGSDGVAWKDLGIYIGPSYKISILFARQLKTLIAGRELGNLEILVPRGIMGEVAAKELINEPKVICRPHYPSSSEDTKFCAERASEEQADLVVFVGGDGTAFDVFEGTRGKMPLLGVPGGTKVYSSIFARSLSSATRLIIAYLDNEYYPTVGEILLVDENKLREMGELAIVKYATAMTIESKKAEEHQQSKDFGASSEDEIFELAECVAREISEEQPLLIGPGRTAKAISEALGIKKSNLLGVSAGWKGKTYCDDCSSLDVLSFCNESGGAHRVKVIVSPLGASGFVLGRGNQQIPISVLKEMSLDNLIVVATRNKVMRLKKLYVDLRGSGIEEKFSGYVRVKIGCEEELVMKIFPA
ncbi:MAG: ATP-NAD kinase family protein [Fervidicoccaceae archaeon]|jgi:predicted polyphosphate/ATP-dependent NAD kinase